MADCNSTLAPPPFVAWCKRVRAQVIALTLALVGRPHRLAPQTSVAQPDMAQWIIEGAMNHRPSGPSIFAGYASLGLTVGDALDDILGLPPQDGEAREAAFAAWCNEARTSHIVERS